MLNQRQEAIFQFLKIIDHAKDVERKILTSSGRPENDAEHSWHLAMMVLLFEKDLPRELDRMKMLKMALMHDLVEIYAGDTFAFDKQGKVTQKQREDEAAEKLFAVLPNDLKQEFNDLFKEFEDHSSAEARFVYSFDKLHPMYMNIFTNGSSWSRFEVDYKTLDDYKRPMMQHDSLVLGLYEHALATAKEKGYLKQE